MQVPLQSFSAPQSGTQASPLQVTVPPLGAWQAVHEVGPQCPTSASLTQAPPHRWNPLLHFSAQVPDWQMA
jgi:hypothetical protein